MNFNETIFSDSLLIFVIGLFIFTMGLSPEFISFQARFALFAQTMFHQGISLFPKTYLGPYADYPSTSIILIYLTSLLLGKVTTLSAILPTAIVSAATLVVIYRIGALHVRIWGLYAVLFALFTEMFLDASRSITPDQWITFVTAACFYIAYSASIFNSHKRWWWIPALLVIAFAFRGPIGMIIPTAVLMSFLLCQGNIKKMILLGLMSFLLLCICSALLLYLAKVQGGVAFAKQVLFAQALGRLNDGSKNVPFYFYWVNSFGVYALAFPMAVLVVFSRLKNIIKRIDIDHRFLFYLLAWALIILIGMSIPGAKKARYILPIVPGISLIAAYLFIDQKPFGLLTWIRKIFVVFCFFFPAILAIVVTIALFNPKVAQLHLHHALVSICITMIVLMGLNIIIRHHFKLHPKNTFFIVAIATLAFVMLNINLIEPINYRIERTKPFADALQALQFESHRETIFYKIGPDAEDVKLITNASFPIHPIFIQTAHYLLSDHQPAYFIAIQKDFDQLPQSARKNMTILHQGKIGHKSCLIFEAR